MSTSNLTLYTLWPKTYLCVAVLQRDAHTVHHNGAAQHAHQAGVLLECAGITS